MSHTPEPWNVWSLAPDSDPEERWIITANDDQDEVTGIVYNIHDAERIVACVKFCAGFSNFDLEEMGGIENLDGVVDERDLYLEYFRLHNIDVAEVTREARISLHGKFPDMDYGE